MKRNRPKYRQPVRDWSGERSGHLTIIGRGPVNTNKKDRHSLWVGICDCGNKRLVRSNELIKGTAKTCGDMKCPYRTNTAASIRVQRGVMTHLSEMETKEALAQPCRLCGTPPTPKARLGLYNAKLGYVPGNVFPLCPKCAGLQPIKKQVARALAFEDLLAHICRILNYLQDTGDIEEKFGPQELRIDTPLPN
jgi:hypothetical protein